MLAKGRIDALGEQDVRDIKQKLESETSQLVKSNGPLLKKIKDEVQTLLLKRTRLNQK